MSILIRGMEMPTNCWQCPLSVLYENPRELLRCKITKEEVLRHKIDGNCPLVYAPPHGRLIDADAFAAEMKKRQDACAEWRDAIKNGGGYGTELYYRADSFLGAMCETKLTLDKIPTIIPAEEGE